MSTLVKYRHLYEVLLRFDSASILRGAHAQYIEGIEEDGIPINAVLGQSIPLSLVDDKDKVTLQKVLGETVYALLTAKESAEAASVEAGERAKAAEVKESEAIAAAEATTESFAHLVEPAAQLEAKNAIIQELMGRVADLEAVPDTAEVAPND